MDGSRTRPQFIRNAPKPNANPEPREKPKAPTIPQFLENWPGWTKDEVPNG